MSYRLMCLILAFAVVSMNIAVAASVSMTAGNGLGTSSYNSATGWSNSLAPSAGNDYFNAMFLLRTPATANTNYTFAGDSLTITGSSLTTASNDALMWKGTGTGVITTNNLTINGGELRHGSGDGDSVTWAGNILTIGGSGAGMASQGPFYVAAPLAGSGQLRILDNGSGGAPRTVYLSSGANTFTGNISMIAGGASAGRARLTLQDNANLNFVIGANGVNNSVSGLGTLQYDGDFNFDLTSAGTTIGNSWLISNPTTQAYGATFTVLGFTDVGSDAWEKSANGVTYRFEEATSTLAVVPEPSTCAAAVAGFLAICLRRKKA